MCTVTKTDSVQYRGHVHSDKHKDSVEYRGCVSSDKHRVEYRGSNKHRGVTNTKTVFSMGPCPQ